MHKLHTHAAMHCHAQTLWQVRAAQLLDSSLCRARHGNHRSDCPRANLCTSCTRMQRCTATQTLWQVRAAQLLDSSLCRARHGGARIAA